MTQLTPEQALANLTLIAETAVLNGPDRRAINESLAIFQQLIDAARKPIATEASHKNA